MPISPLLQYRRKSDTTLEALARALRVNRSTVLRWQKRVPANRLLDIERVTGIPRHRLRPDLAALFSEAAE